LITAKIDSLQLVSRTRHGITVDPLIDEINEAIQIAKNGY